MKLTQPLVFLALFAFALPFQSNAAQQSAGTGAQSNEVFISNVINVTATVKDIDHKSREVTLEGPSGGTLEMTVDKSVKNFDQIQKGDKVDVQYLQSVGLDLQKGTPKKTSEFSQFVEVAPPGQMPSGVAAETVQVTATVKSIDYKNREVTLQGPKGKMVKVNVGKDVKNFDKLKKGDQIVATYTQAVAVSVQKASS